MSKTTAKEQEKKAQLSGDLSDLPLVAKALTAKFGKVCLGDRDSISSTGMFRKTGVLEYVISGEVQEDYEQEKYLGVDIDTILAMLIAAIPGPVEDNMRKACAVAAELGRCDAEGRRPRKIEWRDSAGNLQVTYGKEISKLAKRNLSLQASATKVAKEFASSLKVTRKHRGAVVVKHAEIYVRDSAGEAKGRALIGTPYFAPVHDQFGM